MGLGLHPGVEHEKEDADLGQQPDGVVGLYQTKHRRPYQHPHDELAHHRRQSQRTQGDRYQPDSSQQDQ